MTERRTASRAEVEEVRTAFLSHEHAVMRDDTDSIEDWFCDDARMVSVRDSLVLAGREAIAAFQRSIERAPQRIVDHVHLTPVAGRCVVVVAQLRQTDGAPVISNQKWVRRDGAWRIAAAQLNSTAPDDESVWRLRGTPLVHGSGTGTLRGLRLAVQDLVAIDGFRIGAGNPQWTFEAVPATVTARALQMLLGAGADIAGIAHADEFGYGSTGSNIHYGTPVNTVCPAAIPGGSCSGPGSAVAQGMADVGIGVDGAGSICVPASYLGLYGFRPTHGVISTEGVMSLAPRFDTLGWLCADAVTAQRVGDVLLPRTGQRHVTRMLVPEDFFVPADDPTRAAVQSWARTIQGAGLPVARISGITGGALERWLLAFRNVQAAHESHGG